MFREREGCRLVAVSHHVTAGARAHQASCLLTLCKCLEWCDESSMEAPSLPALRWGGGWILNSHSVPLDPPCRHPPAVLPSHWSPAAPCREMKLHRRAQTIIFGTSLRFFPGWIFRSEGKPTKSVRQRLSFQAMRLFGVFDPAFHRPLPTKAPPRNDVLMPFGRITTRCCGAVCLTTDGGLTVPWPH